MRARRNRVTRRASAYSVSGAGCGFRFGGARHLAERSTHLERVLIEDRDLVVLAEERKVGDHWYEVVARAARFRAHGASRAGHLGAKARLRHTPLLDGRLEEVQIESVGVEEQVLAQILLRQ